MCSADKDIHRRGHRHSQYHGPVGRDLQPAENSLMASTIPSCRFRAFRSAPFSSTDFENLCHDGLAPRITESCVPTWGITLPGHDQLHFLHRQLHSNRRSGGPPRRQASVDHMPVEFQQRRDAFKFFAGLNRIKGFSCRMPRGASTPSPTSRDGWESKNLAEAAARTAGRGLSVGSVFRRFRGRLSALQRGEFAGKPEPGSVAD